MEGAEQESAQGCAGGRRQKHVWSQEESRRAQKAKMVDVSDDELEAEMERMEVTEVTP
jgi:hypothetical protein